MKEVLVGGSKWVGDCREWCMATVKGYGVVGVKDQRMGYAHRLSWEIMNGPIPEGQIIRHTCDNPLCINPKHLLLGSHADNATDRVTRGRSAKGETHGLAKLTERDVHEIRAHKADGIKSIDLGSMYQVSVSTINRIISGAIWTHIE